MANDGQATWNWVNRSLWTDNRLLGDANSLGDYKGPAFLQPAHDLLFVSSQGDMLEYDNALGGTAITMLMRTQQPCRGLDTLLPNPCFGFEATPRNNTHLRSKLFNHNLYVHPLDNDNSTSLENAYGFAWCAWDNAFVSFDDAAYTSGFGLCRGC